MLVIIAVLGIVLVIFDNRRIDSMYGPEDFPRFLSEIPESYRAPCGRPGTLVPLAYETYESFDYVNHSTPLTKTVWVYLPYGYDDSVRYNVFYMIHGGWGNETTTMGTADSPTEFKYIIDNAISEGEIEPLIMVFPTYNNVSSDDSADHDLAVLLTRNYHNELINDLIPAVESRYSTYAESVSDEHLKASRDHRAFGGFSMGSVATWYTFEYCLDYFRYFMPMSGDLTQNGEYLDRIVKNSGKRWSDFFILAMTSGKDFNAAEFSTQISVMRRQTDSYRCADNEREGNLTFRIKEGAEHDASAMMTYSYNGLKWLWNH